MKLFESEQCRSIAETVLAEVTTEMSTILPTARVEHVGSSSIPGALSKGDIDVCIIVAAGQLPKAVSALTARGYVEKTETLRTPQLCMLLSPRRDIDLALQVIETGSQFEFFMSFRDALRSDPALVTRYNRVKKEALSLSDDQYRQAKSRFIEEVLLARRGTSQGGL